MTVSFTHKHTLMTSQKYLVALKILFSIQKVFFLMKQVKHHNGFIYTTEYKTSLVTLIVVWSDIFWKIYLKVFFFFSIEHE